MEIGSTDTSFMRLEASSAVTKFWIYNTSGSTDTIDTR